MKLFFLYLDPSSGSYIIQAIVAAILGSLFYFKNIWLRIKDFFKGNKSSQEEPDKEP